MISKAADRSLYCRSRFERFGLNDIQNLIKIQAERDAVHDPQFLCYVHLSQSKDVRKKEKSNTNTDFIRNSAGIP